jgi:cytochrome c biogenesis protein CcdA
MTISSFLLGLPLYFSTGKFTKLENWIRIIAGLVSIAFGVFLIIELTKELLHV